MNTSSLSALALVVTLGMSLPAFADPLTALSVVSRFPEFKANDSFDQTKIKAALAKVTPDMIVHPVEQNRSENNYYRYQPTAVSQNTSTLTMADECKTKKGLGKFGVFWSVEVQPTRLTLRECEGEKPATLDVNTPGIVWSAEGNSVVFVTLDGGRYRSDYNSKFVPGMPEVTKWPKPLFVQALYAEDMASLASMGAASSETVATMKSASNEYGACNNATWDKAPAEHDRLEAQNLDYRTKDARHRQIDDKYEALVYKQCAPHRQKYEAAASTILTTITKQRLENYELAKTRFAK